MQGRLRLRPCSSGLTKPRWWQKRRFLTLKLESQKSQKASPSEAGTGQNSFLSKFISLVISVFTIYDFCKSFFQIAADSDSEINRTRQKWIDFWACWLFKLFWFFADPGEEQSSRWSIWRNVLYPAFKPWTTLHSFIVIDATKHFWPFNCSPECDYANQTAILGSGETDLEVTATIRSRRFLAIGRQAFPESSSGIFCSS